MNVPYYEWQAKLEAEDGWSPADVEKMFTRLMEVESERDSLRREVARLTAERDALREAARWVPFPANEPPYESSGRGLEYICEMSERYEYAVWPLQYFSGRFYSIDSEHDWTSEVIAFQPLPKAPAPPEGEA